MEQIIEPTVQDPVVQPVVVARPAEPEEKVYKYQPRDEQGRPLGGEQVLKYKTPEELAEKLTAQNVELVKLNRRLTRDLRLGNVPQDTIPQNIERYEGDYEIKPKPLTAEERLQLVQDLSDPEKFDTVQERLIAAKIGDPANVVRALNEIKEENGLLKAEKAISDFLAETPEYYKCEENRNTLCNWMVKNNLKPIKENFKYAYTTLKEQGILLDAPVSAPAVPVPPAPAASEPSPAPAAPRPNLPPAITRGNASDAAPVVSEGDQIEWTYTDPAGNKKVFKGRQALDKMPGDEYRKRMRDPKFRELVDKLDNQPAR